MRRLPVSAATVLCLAFGPTAHAGVFLFGADPSVNIPTLITHPYGYTGTGGALTVEICLSATAVPIQAQVQQAINMWNARMVAHGNCTGRCSTLEDEPPPETNYFIVPTIVHELGHCALGLDHTNNDDNTSHTNTYAETSITNGDDKVPGSSDDVVTILPGARVLHFFRISDNNPFTIDGTVIDSLTYTRRFSDLPPGHLWPANGNRRVGSLLIEPTFSHSLMYSLGGPDTTYSAFIADDVNTVVFGETGLDEFAAPPDDADNYSVQLALVPTCTNADVQVRFSSLPGGNNRPLGLCDNIDIALIPIQGQSPRHYRLVPANAPNPWAVLTIDNGADWDVSALPFSDGFEAGDTSFWSYVSEP
jgi:hypothetical protein